MKIVGRDGAAFGMLPAQQRLEADDLAGQQLHLRLVGEAQLAARNGMQQIVLDMPPLLDLGAHCRFEEPVGAAPFDLGAVKGGVGVAHQALAIDGVVGIDGDADAARNEAAIGRVHSFSARNASMMLSAMRPAAAGSGQAWSDDGEFVAAEPRQHLILVEDAGRAARDRLQQRVAGGMAEKVVDLLEAVEVDAEQRQLAAVRGGHRDLAVELAVEAAAIGQAGQRIVLGEVAQIGFGLLARADVADGDRLPRLVGEGHRACHELDRDRAADGLAQDGLDHFARMTKQSRPQRFVGQEG